MMFGDYRDTLTGAGLRAISVAAQHCGGRSTSNVIPPAGRSRSDTTGASYRGMASSVTTTFFGVGRGTDLFHTTVAR